MNILILGATGFIGKNILKYYSKSGHRITAVCFKRKPGFRYKNIKWIRGDLRNKEFCQKITKKIDIIIQAISTCNR